MDQWSTWSRTLAQVLVLGIGFSLGPASTQVNHRGRHRVRIGDRLLTGIELAETNNKLGEPTDSHDRDPTNLEG